MKTFAAKLLCVVFLCLTGMLGTPGVVHADITFFAEDLNFSGDDFRIIPTNSLAKRAQFLSFLNGAITETFETQTAGAVGPYTIAMGTLSGTGPNTTIVDQPIGTTNGRFPFSGTKFFQQADEFEPVRYSATLLLNTPQRAFGFLASDFGDSGMLTGTLPTVTVHYLDNTTATFQVPSSVLGVPMSGSAAFFGLITDNLFDRVEIVNGTGSRTVGYDDFVVATQVTATSAPEPPSVALIAVACLTLGSVVSKRRTFSRTSPS